MIEQFLRDSDSFDDKRWAALSGNIIKNGKMYGPLADSDISMGGMPHGTDTFISVYST